MKQGLRIVSVNGKTVHSRPPTSRGAGPRLRKPLEEHEVDLRKCAADHPTSIVNLTALANFLREQRRYPETVVAIYTLVRAPKAKPLEKALAWLKLVDTLERYAGYDAATASNGSWSMVESEPSNGAVLLDCARVFLAQAICWWPLNDPDGVLRLCERHLLLLHALGYTDTAEKLLPHVEALRLNTDRKKRATRSA